MKKNLAVKYPHVVIVIPTYNEADNITLLIEELTRVIRKEQKYKFSILVVDDNSPDETQEKVKRFQKKYSFLHLLTGKKKGLGAAYVRGMTYAVKQLSADILFEMDADLSHNPKEISKFLRSFEKGADMVIGSRYIKGGSIPDNWGIDRKLFSVIGNFIIRYGFMHPYIHEWTSGYRLLTKEVFQKINNELDQYKGYIFQIVTLHRAVLNNFNIKEVPIHFIDRKYGTSKIIPREYIPDILKYIFFHSSFIRFVITGGIGFFIDFSVAWILIVKFLFYEPIANTISAAIAVTSNFFINNYWSFSHKKISGGIKIFGKKYALFVLIAIGSVAIQGIGMWILLHLFGSWAIRIFKIRFSAWIFYKIIIIFLFIIPYSYIMYNRFVWRDTSLKK